MRCSKYLQNPTSTNVFVCENNFVEFDMQYVRYACVDNECVDKKKCGDGIYLKSANIQLSPITLF